MGSAAAAQTPTMRASEYCGSARVLAGVPRPVDARVGAVR